MGGATDADCVAVGDRASDLFRDGQAEPIEAVG